MSRHRVLRAGLWALCAVQVFAGAVQLFAPHVFYADFPLPSDPWVSLVPPYSEHLMRDVGALTIAVAVPVGMAAATLDRRLTVAGALGLLVFAVPHFVFHATHLEQFPVGAAITQTAVLALAIVFPVLVLVGARRLPRSADLAAERPPE